MPGYAQASVSMHVGEAVSAASRSILDVRLGEN